MNKKRKMSGKLLFLIHKLLLLLFNINDEVSLSILFPQKHDNYLNKTNFDKTKLMNI